MAKNKIQEGYKITITAGTALSSGDPYVVGQIPGVVIADIASGSTGSMDTSGVYDLSVKAIDGVGNSAVAIGDKLYYVAADTPKISKKDTGVFFGYAMEAIAAGATATINVLLPRSG